MPKIIANGIHIYYESSGTGKPLVLVAGIGYSSWVWHRIVPGLAEHFQVITFDNRGVGKTDKPEGPYSAQMMAEDTAGLLKALGIEQASILGHSMGGFIAQAFALNHAELLDRLILASTDFGGPNRIPVTQEAWQVLTDTSLDPDERTRRGLAVSCAPATIEKQPEVLEELVDYRNQNPIEPAHYQAQLAVGLGLIAEEASFEKKLKNIQAPTLILFGDSDRVEPPGNAELLAGQIPNSQVVILPDAGHFFMLEKPQSAIAAIVEFLQ